MERYNFFLSLRSLKRSPMCDFVISLGPEPVHMQHPPTLSTEYMHLHVHTHKHAHKQSRQIRNHIAIPLVTFHTQYMGCLGDRVCMCALGACVRKADST